MSAMIWILQHLHYIHNHKRRKGRGRGQPWPLHTFWNLTFSYYISSKKGLLSFERKKMKFHHFCPPYENPWFHLENSTISPLVHNVWTMDNWWTTVLWSVSTKLCNSKHFRWFALKNFFGLHIKSLIDLNIFGATFGIGGGQLSHCPPPGYGLAGDLHRYSKYPEKFFSEACQTIPINSSGMLAELYNKAHFCSDPREISKSK